jgi:hypothetical protein
MSHLPEKGQHRGAEIRRLFDEKLSFDVGQDLSKWPTIFARYFF